MAIQERIREAVTRLLECVQKFNIRYLALAYSYAWDRIEINMEPTDRTRAITQLRSFVDVSYMNL